MNTRILVSIVGVLGAILLAFVGYIVQIRGEQFDSINARIDRMEARQTRLAAAYIQISNRVSRMEGPCP